MMRIAAVSLLIALAACGNSASDDDRPGLPPSGSGATRSYSAADFTTIDQRGPDSVDVRVGAGFSVRAEGDPKVLDKLKIERDGQRLRIGRQRSAFGWSTSAAQIYVTMPRIEAAGLAGSGDIAIDRVDGTRFSGDIAGSGSLKIGRVAVDAFKLSIAGAGDVAAAGDARALTVSIAGSGDVDAAKLRAAGATVSIAGSGSVRADVEGDARVSIMGSGDVDLGSKARCTVSKMGSGTVTCGG